MFLLEHPAFGCTVIFVCKFNIWNVNVRGQQQSFSTHRCSWESVEVFETENLTTQDLNPQPSDSCRIPFELPGPVIAVEIMAWINNFISCSNLPKKSIPTEKNRYIPCPIPPKFLQNNHSYTAWLHYDFQLIYHWNWILNWLSWSALEVGQMADAVSEESMTSFTGINFTKRI